MAMESKELAVGSKVVVMRTEGEFDAFEAIIVKVAVTKKSATVMRLEHADQATKEHGAGWMGVVTAVEDNKDLMRAPLEELYKVAGKVSEFIAEFRVMGNARAEITKKMQALADKYGFHVTKVEHEAKKAKKAAEPAAKK